MEMAAEQAAAEPRCEADAAQQAAWEAPQARAAGSSGDDDLRSTVRALTEAVTVLAQSSVASAAAPDSHGKLLEALTEASREGNAMRAKNDKLKMRAASAEGLRLEIKRVEGFFNENRISDRRTWI